MERFKLMKEFVILVDRLPEDALQQLQRLIEDFYIEKAIPFDDEPLTEEDVQALEEGERDIAEGRCIPLEELLKEHGL